MSHPKIIPRLIESEKVEILRHRKRCSEFVYRRTNNLRQS